MLKWDRASTPVLANNTDTLLQLEYYTGSLVLAWCKFDATQSVVLIHGRAYLNQVQGGGLSTQTMSPRQILTTAGVMGSENGFTGASGAKKIYVATTDGTGGLFFEPHLAPAIEWSWDYNGGLYASTPPANGDTVLWNGTKWDKGKVAGAIDALVSALGRSRTRTQQRRMLAEIVATMLGGGGAGGAVNKI